MKPAGPAFPLVEAIAVALAWVAYADEVLEPREAEAIADAVASLVEGPTPGELGRRVRACLVEGKKPLKVGRACLTLAVQPLELRVAVLRSAWLVARSHERASDLERRRVEQLAGDLGVDEEELKRATA